MSNTQSYSCLQNLDTGSIAHRKKLRFARSHFQNALIVRVLHGKKRLRYVGGEWQIQAGELIAITDKQTFDVLNEAEPQYGYQAQWLAICDDWIAQFFQQYPSEHCLQVAQKIPPFTVINEAFERVWTSAQQQYDVAVQQARTWELLAWLRQNGIVFSPHTTQYLVKRVRQIIANDTTQNWSIGEIASQLNMSESTLRRQLAQQQTSFRQLANSIKMMRALTLLQTTQHPIAYIAYCVGYESAARFTARFRQYFGCTPSEVRQAA